MRFSRLADGIKVIFLGFRGGNVIHLAGGKRLRADTVREVLEYKKNHTLTDTAGKFGLSTETVTDCIVSDLSKRRDVSEENLARCARVIKESGEKSLTVAFVTEGDDIAVSFMPCEKDSPLYQKASVLLREIQSSFQKMHDDATVKLDRIFA